MKLAKVINLKDKIDLTIIKQTGHKMPELIFDSWPYWSVIEVMHNIMVQLRTGFNKNSIY